MSKSNSARNSNNQKIIITTCGKEKTFRTDHEAGFGIKSTMKQAQQSYKGSQEALNVCKKGWRPDCKSSVDGQLTSLDAEIGQSKNKGEQLGQLDILSGFKVRGILMNIIFPVFTIVLSVNYFCHQTI
jgi:hypothetical protein